MIHVGYINIILSYKLLSILIAIVRLLEVMVTVLVMLDWRLLCKLMLLNKCTILLWISRLMKLLLILLVWRLPSCVGVTKTLVIIYLGRSILWCLDLRCLRCLLKVWITRRLWWSIRAHNHHASVRKLRWHLLLLLIISRKLLTDRMMPLSKPRVFNWTLCYLVVLIWWVRNAWESTLVLMINRCRNLCWRAIHPIDALIVFECPTSIALVNWIVFDVYGVQMWKVGLSLLWWSFLFAWPNNSTIIWHSLTVISAVHKILGLCSIKAHLK